MPGKPQKDNSGVLFKNDRREKDTHPHATGNALIDGVEYWISAWTKEGAKGRFQSLSFKRKEQIQPPAPQTRRQAPADTSGKFGDMDDDIPF